MVKIVKESFKMMRAELNDQKNARNAGILPKDFENQPLNRKQRRRLARNIKKKLPLF